MRLYLVYGLPPQSMGEVKADCEAALMEAIRRTDSVGYHPDFMSIYALSRLDNGFERRYGSASYSPLNGRIEFKPAE